MRSSRIAYCLARVMDAFVTAKPPFWDGQGFLQRLPRQRDHKLPMASGPPGTVMRAPKGGLLPAGPADTAPHRKIHVFFKLNSCLRRQYPYRFCRAIPMDLSIWCAFMNLLVPCCPCRVLPSAAYGGMDRQEVTLPMYPAARKYNVPAAHTAHAKPAGERILPAGSGKWPVTTIRFRPPATYRPEEAGYRLTNAQVVSSSRSSSSSSPSSCLSPTSCLSPLALWLSPLAPCLSPSPS